jgi:APA family basic amino acid/polyamine antiporter
MSDTSRPGLVRALGPAMATAVVVGTVIGSGVFKKPQAVAENLPTFSMAAVVWILGGVLALLGALSLAEVAVLFPRAGGNYVFLREGYGRLFGFLWGWVEFWIIRTASIAALATFFTESCHDALRQMMGASGAVLSYWEQKTMTMAVVLFLALVNVRGVRWGGGLQLAITIVKVGTLLAITLLPWVLLARVQTPAPPPANYEPPALTLAHFLTAFLGVLWAYHGWMNIAPIAGEVRNPSRTIPLAFLAGVLIVIFVYLGANLAYHQVLPMWEMRSMKDTPVATEFSIRLLGPIGGMLMSGAIMCSVFGALNGNLLVGPRLLYAMGEDRLAPRALGAVHPRYHTPAVAILVMAAWAIGLIMGVAVLTELEWLQAGKSHFDVLTDFAMFGSVTFETLAVSTIFVFRRKLPDMPRPYRCWGYPLVPALYMVLPALVLGNMFINHSLEALTGAGFIALGAGVYLAFCPKTAE